MDTKWKIGYTGYSSSSATIIIPVSEFVDHLLSESHVIKFRCSDGIEETTAELQYNIRPPTSHSDPSISIAPNVFRFSAFGPTPAQRNFSLTLGSSGNQPVYVDYKIDDGEWSLARLFAQLGTQNFEIPFAAFAAKLQIGQHNVTFRARDGPNEANATTNYIVSTVPNLSISNAIVTLPGQATFTETATFTGNDLNSNLLTVLWSIDSISFWAVYKTNVPASEIVVTFNENWPSPRLLTGEHKVYVRVNDGVENSNIVALSVEVKPGYVPPDRTAERVNSIPGTTNADNTTAGLTGGAVAGIVIGVLVVVGAVIVVVIFLLRKKGKDKEEDPIESAVNL